MRLLRSFAKALVGVGLLLREPNARIHVAATLTVVGAGCLLHLGALQWAVIATNIGLVLVLETLNTALEGYVDLAAPGRHEMAARAKDAAAGAVLIASVLAVVVAGLIFLPRLDELRVAFGAVWSADPAGVVAYLAVAAAFLVAGVVWRGKWPA